MLLLLFLEYFEFFRPDFSLHPDINSKQENLNTRPVGTVSPRELKVLFMPLS